MEEVRGSIPLSSTPQTPELDAASAKSFLSASTRINLKQVNKTEELAALGVVANAILNLDETINY